MEAISALLILDSVGRGFWTNGMAQTWWKRSNCGLNSPNWTNGARRYEKTRRVHQKQNESEFKNENITEINAKIQSKIKIINNINMKAVLKTV